MATWDKAETIRELDELHAIARSAFEPRDLAVYRSLCSPDLKYRQTDGRVIDLNRLMEDVAPQFQRTNRAQWSFRREQIEFGPDCVTETLAVRASFGTTVFGIVHQTWDIRRRGRYTWWKAQGRWWLTEVDMIEERMSLGRFSIGFRAPPLH
jgi:hypothetical protein